MKPALLTIDDAPSLYHQDKLDFLQSRGILAIWFCCGGNLEKRMDEAAEAIRRGHVLGNHSWDHPHFSGLSLAEMISQIERTEAVLEEVYRRAQAPRPAKLFRFPFGDNASQAGLYDEMQVHLAQKGFVPCRLPGLPAQAGLDWRWTYDSKDWTLNRLEPVPGWETFDKVAARLEEDDPPNGLTLNQPDGSEVILCHDQDRTTPQFCQLIDLLRAKVQFQEPRSAL